MADRDINRLIDIAELLCESISDQPCGCEGCWLWQDRKEEDLEKPCELKELIKKIKAEQSQEEVIHIGIEGKGINTTAILNALIKNSNDVVRISL